MKLPNVMMVGEAGMLPLTARISFTTPLPVSATKTLPFPSTATLLGDLKLLPSEVCAPLKTAVWAESEVKNVSVLVDRRHA